MKCNKTLHALSTEVSWHTDIASTAQYSGRGRRVRSNLQVVWPHVRVGEGGDTFCFEKL